MPELLEIEVYRRVADRVVGSRIAAVEAPDAWFLKRGASAADVAAVATGATVSGTRRIGKLLLVDLAPHGHVLGLRFGMTGRLVLDDPGAAGDEPITRLEYTSGRQNPAWDRFTLVLDDGRRLRISDPRRLGGVEIDPDVGRLGVDAWAITARQLGAALHGSRAPLKARLLDQARVAGLGNLLVDDALWRAGLDPARPAGDLDPATVAHLAKAIRTTVRTLHRRGGSHRGDLQEHRHRDGRCPLDGAPLDRRTIGGRTTYSCPVHQH
jgi:formamidopyrimidine-DNA glycosylase